MTPKQDAALDYWNYDAGVKQGSATAQAIIERYPDGPSDKQIALLTGSLIRYNFELGI